jgi:hypothetical protein
MYILKTLDGVTTICHEDTPLVLISYVDGAVMINMTGAAVPDWDLLFLALDQVVNNADNRLSGQVACFLCAEPGRSADH